MLTTGAAFLWPKTGLAVTGPNNNALLGKLIDGYIQVSTYEPGRLPPSTYKPSYLVTSSEQGSRYSLYSRPVIGFLASLYDKDIEAIRVLALDEALTQSF